MPLHSAVASLQRSSSNAAGRSAPRQQSLTVRAVSRHPPLLAFTAENPFTSQQKAFVDAYAQVQDWTQHVRRVVGGRTPEQEVRTPLRYDSPSLVLQLEVLRLRAGSVRTGGDWDVVPYRTAALFGPVLGMKYCAREPIWQHNSSTTRCPPLERRQVVLKLYGSLDREMYDQLLDADFRVVSEGQFPKALPREMWVTCLSDMVLPSLPNFNWMPESDGEVDTEGFCTVTVQATGTHNGAPFVLPGLPPVSPSGRTVQLVRESHRVKVEKGKVKEIRIFPMRGAGPGALYEALGGVLPAPSRARQQA